MQYTWKRVTLTFPGDTQDHGVKEMVQQLELYWSFMGELQILRISTSFNG